MLHKIALLNGHASYDVLKTTERYFSIKIIPTLVCGSRCAAMAYLPAL